jgi:hypothetical protein
LTGAPAIRPGQTSSPPWPLARTRFTSFYLHGDGSLTTERLHEEVGRRVKTQGSLPSEDAVLLFSPVVSGQIKLRRIDGWRKIAAVLRQHTPRSRRDERGPGRQRLAMRCAVVEGIWTMTSAAENDRPLSQKRGQP